MQKRGPGACNLWRLLPVPLPAAPHVPQSSSPRLLSRYRSRLKVWKGAVSILKSVNSLYSSPSSKHSPNMMNNEQRECWGRVQEEALKLSQQALRERRSLGLTGVHCLAELLKVSISDYVVSPLKVKQVMFESDRIDEPVHEHVVDMLSVLPPEESEFYR